MKTKVDRLGKVSITVDKDSWDITKSYDRLVIVPHSSGIAYISRCLVPRGVSIENKEYWIPLGAIGMSINVKDYTLLDSEVNLPISKDTYEGPYLIGNHAYFWVNTGGNVEDKPQYQKVQVAGLPGKSAYEIYCDYINELGDDVEPVSESEWSAQFNKLMNLNLVQTITINGSTTYPNNGDISIEVHDGLSAYQLAQQAGFEGTVFDWLNSLKGSDGQNGIDGTPGTNGQDGHTPEMTISSNGTWVVDGVDTGYPARGPQGKAGQNGTLTLEEGEIPTIEFVSNLTTDDDLPNNVKVLTAGAGKQLYTKTRLVIDVMDYNYTNSGNPDLEDVPEDGLVCYCIDDYKLRYFYIQETQPSEQQEITRAVQETASTRSVERIEFDPDPHLLYCDCSEGDAGRIIRYENGAWITVSSGSGGLSMQVSGHKLIFTQSQSGGDFDITPLILATATNTNFGDIERDESKELQFLVKGSHLVDDVTISTTNNKVLFYIGTDTPSSSLTLTRDNKGKLNGNAGYTINVIYTAPAEVLTNTDIEFVVEIASDNAETKSITFTGREVPEKVPMLYLDENDETVVNTNFNIYTPLFSATAAQLDDTVVGTYGMTKNIRVYVKNIEGTVNVTFRDDENDSTEFSLDNLINNNDVPSRITSKDFYVSEDGHIDIPLRLPKQSEVVTLINQLIITFGTVNAYVNVTGYCEDYNVTGKLRLIEDIPYCAFNRVAASDRIVIATATSTTTLVNLVGLYYPSLLENKPISPAAIKLECPEKVTTRCGYTYNVEFVYGISNTGSSPENYRYMGDSNLLSVDLHGIKRISDPKHYGFASCVNLKYVRVRKRVLINEYEFTDCSNLKVCMFDAGFHYKTASFGNTKLEHIIIQSGKVHVLSNYPFPTITISEDDIINYNNIHTDVAEQLTNDDLGIPYFGYRDANDVPVFTVLHKTANVTFTADTDYTPIYKSTYEGDTTSKRFKIVLNDAASIEGYDVDNDELIYTSNNS